MVLLIVALACGFGTPKWTPDPVDSGATEDVDGDGYTADDCAPEDPAVHPGAAEVWYDGLDQNCDGNDADQDGDRWIPQHYADAHPDWASFPAHLAPGDCADGSPLDQVFLDEDDQPVAPDDVDLDLADIYPNAPLDPCYDGTASDDRVDRCSLAGDLILLNRRVRGSCVSPLLS